MEADRFDVDLGGWALGVVSEAAELRVALSDLFDTSDHDLRVRDGLLIGRPGVDLNGRSAAWMQYESGDNLLCRSRSMDSIVSSAHFHLESLRRAAQSAHLPLRMKTFLLPDGRALLVDAPAVHSVAGFDRRLRRRGCIVLPSTIAVVDVESGELVLPEDFPDPELAGRRPVARVVARWTGVDELGTASLLLPLCRSVVRFGGQDLGIVLDQIDRLASAGSVQLDLLPQHEITQLVDDLR